MVSNEIERIAATAIATMVKVRALADHLLGAGNANTGGPFLLSAFAAAFLGSTQFKGRFNVWGTVAAVWVLLSPNPDFRWFLDRTDSPWYPSARLFRADSPGDWGSVVDRVKIALDAELPVLQTKAVGAQPSGLGALSHWLTTWRRR